MNPQTIRKAFDRLADRYDRHAALEKEVCTRLLERTAFCRQDPACIIDLGCGTGFATAALKQQYPGARVIGLDSSAAMLAQLRRGAGGAEPVLPVCADLGALPFSDRSADLVVSNFASFWSPDPMVMFSEIRRVIRPDGMLLFSTMGPAALKELRQAWAAADRSVEVPQFADLLEVGDALVAAGFGEPVMDVDTITLSYPTLDALLDELEATGTSMLVLGWERRADRKSELEAAYAPLMAAGRYPLSIEVVYGLAFGPQEGQPRKTAEGEVATFSVESLLRERRGRKPSG